MRTAKTVWLQWAQSVLAYNQEHKFSHTRRNFLKNTSKSAIGIALAPSLSFSGMKLKSPRIAIIGGGLAGMTCAWRLKKAGLKPEIYEASDRIGGRTLSMVGFQKRGKTCEIGGEFFTSDHHHIVRLARDLRKRIYTSSQPNRQVKPFKAYFGQKEIPLNELEKSLSLFYENILEDLDSLPKHATWENASQFKQFDQLSISKYLVEKNADQLAQLFLNKAFTIENGMEADEQSAMNLLQTFKEGFLYHPTSKIRSLQIKGGNQSLCDEMSNNLWKTIHTHHRLTEINHHKDGYQLKFKNGKRTKKVKADYVVIAIPFSVFRKIESNVYFNNRKNQAIQELGYGKKSRLVLGFSQKSWKEQGYAGLTFSDEMFGYGNDQSPREKGKHQALSVKPSGAEAIEFDRMNTYTATMKCLKSFEKIYPGISKDFDGQAMKFSWMNDQNFLGSNSCYKIGQRTAFGGEEGKSVEDLFFAGEHCSMKFKGTMNGAVQSGTLAASNIARRIKRANTKRKFWP